MPVDREARAVGLDDLERSQVGSHRRHRVGRVVPVLHRKRPETVVLETHHLELVQVDDRVHALDRPGVRIVVRIFAGPARAPDEPATLVLRLDEVSDAPRLDRQQARVLDAAAPQRLEEALVAAEHVLARGVLAHGHGRLHVVALDHALNRPGGKRHDHLAGQTCARRAQDGARAPVGARADVELVLARLVELEHDDPRAAVEQPGVLQDGGRRLELGGVERVQGMCGRHLPEVRHRVLELRVVLERVDGHVVAVAGLLHPRPGHLGDDREVVVDPDGAEPQPP